MKKIFLAMLFIMSIMLLVSCDIGGSTNQATPNYNADVKEVLPENITAEHFVKEENTTYYTSQGLSLWLSVNGEFLKLDYFSLEGNKRVYDNLYLYEDDYFFILTDDNKDLYASLSSNTSEEYAEEEKESGYDIQINVKKSGIYKLVFDVDTLKFDMEYKAEIETPVYYTIKNCSIYSIATNWVEMEENENGFYINNFSIKNGETIGFFNNIHVSNYNVTLHESCDNKYASARKTIVTVNVGGIYNVYINKKTYEVRLELQNPETATYGCIYYDGAEFIELEPYDPSIPYVFRQRIVVDSQYQNVPNFHSKKYGTYDLDLVKTDELMGSDNNYYFKKTGTYDVIINLKTFEITAELLPE